MTEQAIKLFSAALLFCTCRVRTDSLAILLKQWREDSVGCQHVRSFESFKRQLKGYSLEQKKEDEILKVLGPPNAEEKYPGKSIVIYFFSSICTANKIIKGADRSMIEVSFDDQKRFLRYDPAIGQTSPAGKEVVTVDTTVNNTLKLLDAASIRQSIGDQRKNLIEDERATRIQLANHTNSEYIILYHLDGSNGNSFNEFEVGTLKEKSKGFKTTSFASFSTESGVHVGITLDSLVAIKGKKFKRTEAKGNITLSYRLTDKHMANNILTRHNMPIYEAEYVFRDNKLIKFSFGFPDL